jgi:hypothetical protein
MPRFTKGNQFSARRQLGSRNRATLEFDGLAAHGTAKLIDVLQRLAEGGDVRAASVLLARTWPRRRSRPVTLDLPAVETSAGLVKAQAALVAAMSRGEVTPDEAAAIGSVLEIQRRTIEMHDHELRLQELEARGKAEPGTGSLATEIARIAERRQVAEGQDGD